MSRRPSPADISSGTCPASFTARSSAPAEVGELRRIAAKSGHKSEQSLSDYDVHSSFVAAAKGKNSLSISAHKALEKKYPAYIRRFAKKARDEEAVIVMWRTALAEG